VVRKIFLLIVVSMALLSAAYSQGNGESFKRIDSIDKRYKAAIDYLYQQNEELRQKWAESYQNKKLKKVFLNTCDSVRFIVSDTLCPKGIELPSLIQDAGIKLPEQFVAGGGQFTIYSSPANDSCIVAGLQSLSPFSEADFRVGFANIYQNNLVVEVFCGICKDRRTDPSCSGMKLGEGLSILFIFSEDGKVSKVYYSDSITHYN
jgi:hypothetical protein